MGIHVQKNILLTPYWIVSILERNNLDLKCILDLDTLFPITSADDLASISLLNSKNTRVLGVNVYSPALYMNWQNNSSAWCKFRDQVEPLEPLITNDLEDRLFNESSKVEKYQDAFAIKDIDASTLLVIIYPGYFGGPEYKKHQYNLTKELMKLFYLYEGYDNMAKRMLFEQYINQI